MHVPALPATLQASHWPVHALSQQYPSTQVPLPHWLPAVHVAPFGNEQVPVVFALHTRPGLQLALWQHALSTQCPLEHCVSPVQ